MKMEMLFMMNCDVVVDLVAVGWAVDNKIDRKSVV